MPSASSTRSRVSRVRSCGRYPSSPASGSCRGRSQPSGDQLEQGRLAGPLRPTSPERTGPATKLRPSNTTSPSGQAKDRSVQEMEIRTYTSPEVRTAGRSAGPPEPNVVPRRMAWDGEPGYVARRQRAETTSSGGVGGLGGARSPRRRCGRSSRRGPPRASPSSIASTIAVCSARVRSTAPAWVTPRQIRARWVAPEMPSSSEHTTALPVASAIARWNRRSFATSSSTSRTRPACRVSSRGLGQLLGLDPAGGRGRRHPVRATAGPRRTAGSTRRGAGRP